MKFLKYRERKILEITKTKSSKKSIIKLKEQQIDILLAKSIILELIGEWEECQKIRENALYLIEKTNNKSQLVNINNLLGEILYGKGNYTKAIEYYENSLLISKKSIVNISSYTGLGNLHSSRGNYDKAMEYYEKGLEIANKFANKKNISNIIGNIGVVYWLKGDYDKAMEYYEKQLKIVEELNIKRRIGLVLNNIGIIYADKGDYNKSMKYYEKSLHIVEQIGDKEGISRAVLNMGTTYVEIGEYDKAMKCYERSLKIDEELESKENISYSVGNMGVVYARTGNYEMALKCYDRAIELEKELDVKDAEVPIEKADVLFLLKRYDEAKKLIIEGIELAKETDNDIYFIKGKVLLIKIDFIMGKKDAINQLYEMLKDAIDNEEMAILHYEIYKMNNLEKHHQIALELYQKLYKKTPNIEYKNRIEELIILF